MFERCVGGVGTRKRYVWFVWGLMTLGAMLLCIFSGLTATALERLVSEYRKVSTEDNTATRMLSLLQANSVGAMIFVMVHFMTSLAFLMGRWFTSAPPGTLYAILCTQTAFNVAMLLSMASPLIAYDMAMEDLKDASGKGSDGLDLWPEEKLSYYRISFALMFTMAGANATFLAALVAAKAEFGPPPEEEQRGGFWSRGRRDVEAPPPPQPPAEKGGFLSRFGRGDRDQAPAQPPPPPQRSASPDDNMRSNPLFRFGRGNDAPPPPPPPQPRYLQAPEAPQPAFANAFSGGRFAGGGDSNPFGDSGGGGASDNPFASAAGSMAWGAATSPGAASRGAALYDMSTRR